MHGILFWFDLFIANQVFRFCFGSYLCHSVGYRKAYIDVGHILNSGVPLDKKTAIAFGSFDVLHPGHIHYLKGASRYGKLIVVVARDNSIKKLKGRAPVIDEKSRLEIVGSLRFVDRSVLGDRIRKWNDIYKILLRYRPDYIVLGYDQKVDTAYLNRFLEENKLRSKIVRLRPFRSEGYKSRKLKKLLKIA